MSSTAQIREFARVGAAARIKELTLEIAAIHKAFPGIQETGVIATARVKALKANGQMPKKAGKRSGMSAVARKAVSVRMKKYWEARRKAEK